METTTKRTTWVVVVIGAVIVVAVGGFVYARFFAGDAPAEAALSSPSVAPSATGAAGASDGFEGTWTVDAASGSLVDGSSTFAGYRIDEELSGIGANTAVGRTQNVSGTMTIEATAVTSLDVTVDMTTLASDDSRRDGQMVDRGLQTSSFPTATFSLTDPIEIGDEPAVGEVIEISATGDLTLHGVTNTVEVPIEAQWTGTHIEVLASVDVTLTDYDIEAPVGFLVVSVAETGTVELHLLFAKEEA